MDHAAELTRLTSVFGEDPLNTAKLDAALRPYLGESEVFGAVLRHPLVYQVPFYSWALANQAFAEKRALVERRLREGDYDRAIWYYERPYRLSTLHEWWAQGLVGVEGLRVLLPHVWVDTENGVEAQELALEMFHVTGFVTDDVAKARRQGVGRGTRLLRIYRGVRAPGLQDGIAWTLDPHKARWFADRFGGRGIVLRGSVESARVLGYFVGRGEQEVVVDPADVEDAQENP